MRAKKSLGQHFLASRHALDAIIGTAGLTPGETVLEVGPGMGVLTARLLEAGGRVVAVEKDDRLIEPLKETFRAEIASGKLTLIHDDILRFDVSCFKLCASSFVLVANIPYYITGAFLRKFLGGDCHPSRMVLLLQKEVAKRIVARDGKESLLSISVKAYGEPRYVKTVKAGSFSPAPKVDSAILAIKNISKENFADADEEMFFALLKSGFGKKRKLLFSNLGVLPADREKIAATCGISPNARAEDVPLHGWLCLTKVNLRLSLFKTGYPTDLSE